VSRPTVAAACVFLLWIVVASERPSSRTVPALALPFDLLVSFAVPLIALRRLSRPSSRCERTRLVDQEFADAPGVNDAQSVKYYYDVLNVVRSILYIYFVSVEECAKRAWR
jgi:hypothetical protein